MAREIKFRAWDTDFQKMVSVNNAKFANGTLIGAKGVNWDSKVIVMQFTGLLDKNGKEIYEGDVVKDERYVHEVRFGTACIDASDYEEFCVETIGFYLTHYLGNPKEFDGMSSGSELEIIGNIYEHGYLLKEGDSDTIKE